MVTATCRAWTKMEAVTVTKHPPHHYCLNFTESAINPLKNTAV